MSTLIETANPPTVVYPDPFRDTYKGTVRGGGSLHRNPVGAAKIDVSFTGGKRAWPGLTLKFLTQAQRDALAATLFAGVPIYIKFVDRGATVYTCVFAPPQEMSEDIEMLGDGSYVYHVVINQLVEV